MASNLWTPADGLLNTHVTWNDLEEAFRESFGERAIMGPNKSLSKIGEGNGFLSNIAKIYPDWQGTDTEGLPAKFISKMCTCINVMDMAKSIQEQTKSEEDEADHESEFNAQIEQFAQLTMHLHNTEIFVYDLIKKHIKPTESLAVLNMYFKKPFSQTNTLKAVVGFDFVENVYPRHCYHNVKPTDLSEVLRTIAKLQVITLRSSPQERQRLPNIVEKMYGKSISKDKIAQVFKSFSSLVSEKYLPIIEEIKEYADVVTNLSLTATITEQLGMDPVFVHGDLWSSNVLWKKTENGIEFLKLIDFQVSHFGCPAEDFIRLFNSTLSGEDFMNCWETLLEEFYGYLLEELGAQKAPYTLEQLKESYERLLPQALIILLFIVQPIAQAGRKNNNDGEESSEVLQQKIEAALISMLKSLKKFK